MGIRSYQDLIAWQKAIELAKATYTLVEKLPKEEMYSLSDQMRRAAVSIPSNIAEGQARASTKEFINFLSIAQGSNAELQTQVILCGEFDYFSKDDADYLLKLSYDVGRLISALSASLRNKEEQG